MLTLFYLDDLFVNLLIWDKIKQLIEYDYIFEFIVELGWNRDHSV